VNRAIVALLIFLVLLAGLDPVFAQVPPSPPPPADVTVAPSVNAHEIRERLWDLLRKYPPALGEVLQRDPSLLNERDYLAPYPALVAFLAQHPEISRNPSFFLGSYIYHEQDPKERAYEMLGVLLAGIAGTTVVVAIISLLVWVIRSVIDHRRWLRVTRVQTEVHTKLMDRFTNNEDLLAYIQSPAARRFLESTPIALDGEARPTSAPVARILWSLQAGIVLMALGGGFWFNAQGKVLPEVSDGFYVLGVVATALGVGFSVSALAAYVISARLKLFAGPSRNDV
jgi:hypothetical protein